MAEEMVKRVATALAERALIEMGSPELVHDPAYVGRFELAGVDLRKLARSAIEAMAEPTEEMAEAAGFVSGPGFTERDHKAAREVWNAMIVAALGKKG